jgi:thiol-disulfide isomerase/thioredoxin
MIILNDIKFESINCEKKLIFELIYMKKILFSFGLLSIITTASAQKGHDIKINFKNCKDTVMYLAFYQFDKSYLADTCKKIIKGNVVFKSPKTLERGVYYLVSQDKARYFDFFVSDANQNMVMSADNDDLVKSLKSTSHKENDDFFSYIKFITAKNKEFGEIRTQTKGMSIKDSTAFINEKSKALNESVIAYEKSFLDAHKGTFIGDVINLKMEKEAKDIPKASNGRPDSLFIYHYYKNHFWDGVNFQDDGILRTPFFADRVKRYFSSIIAQHPDSVNLEIDRMMSKTKQGSEMHKFLLAYFTPTYESSKVMGFDKVFVHIIDTYFRTGQAKGIYEEKTIEKIKERGDILKPLLLGSQAPELMMVDTTGHKAMVKMGFDTVKTSAGATNLYYKHAQELTQAYTTLYNTKADYLILVFWDVDCGHCKTEIPKLLEEYHALQKEKYDIKVFSVYTQHEYAKYRQYIIDNKLDWINVYDGVHVNNIKEKYDIYSTPVIYMLDRNKRIKAKRIGVEQVKDIIKQMEREYKLEKK